eukprot:89886-Alexandrium_andersonii.AAC.1
MAYRLAPLSPTLVFCTGGRAAGSMPPAAAQTCLVSVPRRTIICRLRPPSLGLSACASPRFLLRRLQ